jgi:Protein of unknown function (DUF2971)
MLIYKYVPEELVATVVAGTLRATQPEALNDLFELPARIDRDALAHELDRLTAHGISRDDFDDLRRQAFVMEEVAPELMKLDFRNLDFDDFNALIRSGIYRRIGIENLVSMFQVVWSQLRARLGIVSFGANWNMEQMWAYYASTHAGAVLGFETEPALPLAEHVASDLNSLHRVNYVDVIPFVAFAAKTVVPLLWTKGACWSAEQEWRLVVPLRACEAAGKHDARGHEVFLWRYHPAQLKEVILGVRASKACIDEIREVVSRRSPSTRPRVFKAVVGSNGVSIEREEIAN